MNQPDNQQSAEPAYRHISQTGYGGGKRAGPQRERVLSQSISSMTNHRPGQNAYRRRGSENDFDFPGVQASLLQQRWEER